MGQRRWLRRHQRITKYDSLYCEPEKMVTLKSSRKAKRADRRADTQTSLVQGLTGRQRLAKQGLDRLYRKWEREGPPF